MQLDAMLKKAGVTLVKVSENAGATTLLLRIPKDGHHWWARAVEQFLLLTADQPAALAVKWNSDVSRMYFVDKEAKVVRYLWRIVLSGNRAAAADALATSLVQSRSEMVEVTSAPLVGRRDYSGKETMGAHSLGSQGSLIARSGNGTT
jgi:hypothetical protein